MSLNELITVHMRRGRNLMETSFIKPSLRLQKPRSNPTPTRLAPKEAKIFLVATIRKQRRLMGDELPPTKLKMLHKNKRSTEQSIRQSCAGIGSRWELAGTVLNASLLTGMTNCYRKSLKIRNINRRNVCHTALAFSAPMASAVCLCMNRERSMRSGFSTTFIKFKYSQNNLCIIWMKNSRQREDSLFLRIYRLRVSYLGVK